MIPTPGAHVNSAAKQTTFVLYAPRAATARVHLHETSYAMQQIAYGYWQHVVEADLTAEQYRFSVDDSDAFADPASQSQPQGVHGPSEVVDHTAFTWQDQGFVPVERDKLIIYELHVGTFTPEGSFTAAASKLPHLQQLGITAVELMPVASFAGERNWGYDGVSLFAPQQSYGGVAGLKFFVNEAHRHGIAVILDVVYNHFGPEGNYSGQFGPYTTDMYRTPWGSAVNFDQWGSIGVRQHVLSNVEHWLLRYHIDGLRLDAVHGIIDTSVEHILAQITQRAEQLSKQTGRAAYVFAESDKSDPRTLNSVTTGGLGMHGQWSDDFHHCVHTLLTAENRGYYNEFGEPGQLKKAIEHSFVFNGVFSPARMRLHGGSVDHLPCDRFIICSQNHDQTGNRMLGERLSHLCGPAAARLAACATLLSPAIPLLFMGEEFDEPHPFLYFVNHGDAHLIEAVRAGRKEEFKDFSWQAEPPDPQAEQTFLDSKLSWNCLEQPRHRAMLEWYQHLIRVRNEHAVFRCMQRGSVTVDMHEQNRIFFVKRQSATHQAVVLLHFSDTSQQCTWPFAFTARCIADSCASHAQQLNQPSISPKENIHLRPYQALVFLASDR